MLLYEDILECMDRPLIEGDEQEAEPQPKVAPSTGRRSANILIVESDPTSLESLREMCAVLGYAADEVATAEEAIAYLERGGPNACCWRWCCLMEAA